jgi:type IV secretion system protein VirD4
MTPTKLLIGQILVVFKIVLLALWAATQWTAAKLAYQPELGPAWFMFGAFAGLSPVGAVSVVVSL